MTLSTTKKMILLGFFLLQCTAAKFDCGIGCSLDASAVCGNDGITYPNECFAVCQDAVVAHDGPCGRKAQASRVEKNETSTELQGFVTMDVIKRFFSEGYSYVRKVDIGKLKAPTKLQMSEFNGKSLSNPVPALFRAIRLTSDGHEYESKEIMIDQMGSPRSVKGAKPRKGILQLRKRNNSTRRQLSVVGSDERTQISDTTVSPYNLIGRLEMGCTGTVIYNSAVLTAGHCVRNEDGWTQTMAFTPGKNGQSEPYGSWEWDTVTTYQEFIDSEDGRFDMAVIKYKTNANGQTLGAVVGYAGLDEVSSFDDPDLDKSVITGYPADKGFGEMWTSGYCPSGYWSDGTTSSVARHDCDTFGGHSGSALLRPADPAWEVSARGVHIHGCGDAGCTSNGALIFLTGTSHFQSAIDWSRD